MSDETGLGASPTTVIGNNDLYVKKCLALLNKVGKELTTYDWQVLTKEQTFTTDGTGDYTRAAIFTDGDFDRYVNNTDWDRSNQRKMQLVTAPEWQVIKSSVSTVVGIVRYYREKGNTVYIEPDASGDTVVFEYYSNYWITDSTGVTSKGAFTVDTDLVKFPEYLVELGLKYKLKAGEGLPAVVEREEYDRELARNIGFETPKRVLGRNYDYKFTNLPDTGIGQ